MSPSSSSPNEVEDLQLTPEMFDAFTRLDFWLFCMRVYFELHGAKFLNNFHIELLAFRLNLLRQQRMRVAISLPPRSLKSIVITIALPAWLLGHNPGYKIICVSYGQELAEKLAADCRQVMQSDWYRALFPKTRLAHGRQALNNFQTTAGGYRISTSTGGVLTGFGADLIIVDDGMKPEEAYSEAERNKTNHWTRHTLFTRLNDKQNGSIILVMQRLHEDDLIGHLRDSNFEFWSFPAIAQEDERHVIGSPFGSYEKIRLTGEALHPEREPLAVLAQLRADMGSQYFSAQYLQAPAPKDGSIFQAKWFRRHDFGLADLRQFSRIIQSWDTAAKASQLSDYSVCMTFGVIEGVGPRERKIYLLDVRRVRLEYPELRRLMVEHARLWKAHVVLVEDTASGMQLIQDLHYEGLNIQPVVPKGDKVMRAQAQTPAIERGQVLIPNDVHWLDDFLHELMMFPVGKYDDQVDSLSQALAYITPPTEFENFMEFVHGQDERDRLAELRRQCGGVLPTIRLRHRHPNTRLTLCSGRMPDLESDGSFLVTEGELWSALGDRDVFRVDELPSFPSRNVE